MKHMLFRIMAVALVLSAFAMTGCACSMRGNQIVQQTPTTTPNLPQETSPAKTTQNSAVPATGVYSFSYLQQDADGTTTDVWKDAYLLHYNADMFDIDPAMSNEYMAAFTTKSALGVDFVTVRIVPARDDFGLMADCFDYYDLQMSDDAEMDDLKTLATQIGQVTYYITTANLEGDGQSVRAYYAVNMGDVAFCGTMDIALDAEANLLDDRLLRRYAEEFFDEGIADTVFENLFMDVEAKLPTTAQDQATQDPDMQDRNTQN